jgi:hypothetical protein
VISAAANRPIRTEGRSPRSLLAACGVAGMIAEPRESIEAGVRGQEEQQRGEGLEQVEQRPVAVDLVGHLGDYGLLDRVVDRADPEVDGDEGQADEQDPEQGGHHRQRRRRVLRFRRLERRYARGDRLGAGQGHGPGGEGAQDQDGRQWLEGAGDLFTQLRTVGRPFAQDDDAECPDGDHQQGRTDEQVGRDSEDVAGLAQPAEIAQGDHGQGGDPDQDALVEQGRERGGDLLHRRCGRDCHRHDVVDQERRRSHERDGPTDVSLRDRVRPAAGRVGEADLAVAQGHGDEQHGDGDAD